MVGSQCAELHSPSGIHSNDFFRTPQFLRCELLGVSNRDLVSLISFLESLRGGSKPLWSVMCSNAPPGLDLASLFHLIKDLGCSDFDYSSTGSGYSSPVIPDTVSSLDPSGVCHLRSLALDSPAFFSPSVALLTLSTLRNSLITNLSLTLTGLSSIQWATVLQNVYLPRLSMFKISICCPPHILTPLSIPTPFPFGSLQRLYSQAPTNDTLSTTKTRKVVDRVIQGTGQFCFI